MRILPACILILPLFLAACFGSDSDGLEPVEVASEDALTSDTPETILAETAKRLYGNGLFSVARTSFETLHANYPLGPYAEFAQIKAADCYFMAHEYESAATGYQAFLKDHPSSPSRDYVTFKTGLSHHLSSNGVGHDIGPFETAITFFKDTLRLFPDSPYAANARYYMEEAEESIASHKKEVMEFYAKQGMQDAYEARKIEFDSNYAALLNEDPSESVTSSDSEKVLLATPVVYRSERQRPAEKPSKDFAEPAPAMDTAKAMLATPVVFRSKRQKQEDASPTMVASLKPIALQRSNFPAYPRIRGNIRLESVQCSGSETDSKRVTLIFDDSKHSTDYLDKFASTHKTLQPGTLALVVPIENLDADIREFTCFGRADVAVSPLGQILIKTPYAHDVMHLEHPNRLLLIKN